MVMATNGSDVKYIYPLINGSEVKYAFPLTKGSDVKYIFPWRPRDTYFSRKVTDTTFRKLPQIHSISADQRKWRQIKGIFPLTNGSDVRYMFRGVPETLTSQGKSPTRLSCVGTERGDPSPSRSASDRLTTHPRAWRQHQLRPWEHQTNSENNQILLWPRDWFLKNQVRNLKPANASCLYPLPLYHYL